MRELKDISNAFETLCREGRPSALATVVGVEGSSYRRPGARMLIAEDGRTWGGVSGGCLERDVARRGLGAIASGHSCIARYDTADDEPGSISTGCGGVIEVFIQPLSPASTGPMRYLTGVLKDRRSVQIVTVIRAGGSFAQYVGESAMAEEVGKGTCNWPEELQKAAAEQVEDQATNSSRREACSSREMFFTETVRPPQRLVIYGGGPDVVPVVSIARTLGWHVTVVANRPGPQAADRFAAADALLLADANDPTAGVEISSDSAVLVMTHNVARDAAVLRSLQTRPRYLGVLGPRHRTEKILHDWPLIVPESQVYSPVGLDLGADTPEEIALSIVAEIQKSLSGATGESLREREFIHQSPAEPITAAPPAAHGKDATHSCPI